MVCTCQISTNVALFAVSVLTVIVSTLQARMSVSALPDIDRLSTVHDV